MHADFLADGDTEAPFLPISIAAVFLDFRGRIRLVPVRQFVADLQLLAFESFGYVQAEFGGAISERALVLDRSDLFDLDLFRADILALQGFADE